MNATVANPEVRAYLEAVRAHLLGVPDTDLQELIDDFEGHLLEVAAEDDGSLEDRLGPPAVYAEELRDSAGLPSGQQEGRERLTRRMLQSFERSAPGRMLDLAWSSKTVRALRSFLPDLQPGWWVLRGYLLISAAAILAYEGVYRNPAVPFALGGYAQGILLVIGAIVGSVALGRAAKRHDVARRLSFLASGLIVALAVAAVGNLGDTFVYYPEEPYAVGYEQPGVLTHASGHAIANICPYSADGKLLTGVLLFDQDGRPIDDTVLYTTGGAPIEPLVPQIGNAYPRDFTGVEKFFEANPNYSTGTQTPLTCPPMLTGLPSPIPTPGGG